MSNPFFSVVYHESCLTVRQGASWLTPLFFYVIVISFFALALSHEPRLLKKEAPSIIWMTSLLAVILSVNQLFKLDKSEGFTDLLFLSPYPLSLLMFAKVLAHWLTHCLPLILISPLVGYLLQLAPDELGAVSLSLLLGTPTLNLMGAIGAALIVRLRGGGLLLPILIMPLYIPVLIFGIGMIFAAGEHQPLSGYAAILGALLLLSLAFGPLLTAISLRIGVSQ